MYLGEILERLIEKGVTTVPHDVEEALSKAHSKERNKLAKMQLALILKNVGLAKKNSSPLCQDTGVPVFYVRIGRRCSHVFDIDAELAGAVSKATKRALLRPNIVDPLTRSNPGTNVLHGVPIVHYSIFDGDHIEITFVPKGAGSENMSELFMLRPGIAEKEIERLVIEKVKAMGGKPCPPYIIGIGMGGTSERCLELAKFACMRTIGSKNQTERIAKLESRLLASVNKTGIGPMGLGGDATCLAAQIEYAGCHTATMPVAIAITCWADRKAKVILRKNGHSWVD